MSEERLSAHIKSEGKHSMLQAFTSSPAVMASGSGGSRGVAREASSESMNDGGKRALDANARQQRAAENRARMEAEMARVVRLLEPDLAGSGVSPLNLMAGFLMKTSARNALRGVVTQIEADQLQAEVAVQVSQDTVIHANVTNASLRELGLCVGREAIVLIKAPFVMVALDEPGLKVSARNAIAGVALRCETSPLSAEVIIDIG